MKNLLKFLLPIFLVSSFFITQNYAEQAAKSGLTPNDGIITSMIHANYLNDALLRSTHISITTQDKVVHLAGQLASDTAYERAVTIAASTPYVKKVDTDDLTIQGSHQPLTDTYITGIVKGKLIRNKIFNVSDVQVWPVKVETKNGTVYLSGHVDTQKQKDNIISLARHSHGVHSVNYAALNT